MWNFFPSLIFLASVFIWSHIIFNKLLSKTYNVRVIADLLKVVGWQKVRVYFFIKLYLHTFCQKRTFCRSKEQVKQCIEEMDLHRKAKNFAP